MNDDNDSKNHNFQNYNDNDDNNSKNVDYCNNHDYNNNNIIILRAILIKMFYFPHTELIMDRDDPDYEDGANGTFITVLTV